VSDRVVAAPPASPYKGLASFEDSDRDATLFFGREREREIIAANLLAYRLTVLYGASGVGKSSVLRAGVAYHMRQLAHENLERLGHPQLAVAVFGTWSGDPVAGLLAEVRRELVGLFGEERVAATAGGLADSLAVWSTELECELYIVLDQVDEYFLYHDADDDFVLQFADAATRDGLRVNFVVAIREDMLAKLDRFKGRIPNLFSNYLRLDHLDREAARAAIVGPIEQHNASVGPDRGVAIEPELVEAVLDQTVAGRVRLDDDEPAEQRVERPGRVEAPYLQLVMQRLWEEDGAGAGVLRLETLERLGGATAIVRAHLGAALGALSPREQDLAETLFNYLVTPSGTKIAHGLGDLAEYAAVPERTVLPVLATLVEERIVRPVTEGGAPDVSRYEIYHDVLAEPVSAWRARHASERELAEQRRAVARRHRVMAVVTGVSLVALAAMAFVTIFALHQKNRAEKRTVEKRAASLTVSAYSLLTVNPERSLVLALQAARLVPDRAAESPLRDALVAANGRAVLRGGGGSIRAAKMSRDGSLVLVVGKHEARIFRRPSLRRIRLIRVRSDISAADLSPNGAVIAIATGTTVSLVPVRAGPPVETTPVRHGGTVNSVAFSADSKQLVTGSEDRIVRLRDVATGMYKSFRNEAPVESASISPDGKRVVTVPTEPSESAGPAELMKARFARLFDTKSGRLVSALQHGKPVRTAIFSPDSRLIVTSAANTGRVWNANTGDHLRALLPAAPAAIVDSSFSRDGESAVLSSQAEPRVYSASTGDLESVLSGHIKDITDVAFSGVEKATRLVAAASEDGSVRVWRQGGLPTSLLLGHRDSVTSVTFSPGGDTLLTGSDDGRARLWDPNGAEPRLELLGSHQKKTSVSDVSFSADGTLALSAGDDGTARIWPVRGGRVVILRHGGTITGARFAGDVVVTASTNGTAKVWRLDGGLIRTLRHGAPITAVAATPGAITVVTSDARGLVQVWRNRHVVAQVRHGAKVNSMSIDPAGRRLLTASDDKTAVIWRLLDGRQLHRLVGHTDAVLEAAFSPNGRRVATASRDNDAALWNAGTGRLLRTLEGHSDDVISLSFSRTGDRLLTASLDTDAWIWSLRSGKGRRLRGHVTPLSDAAFSFDGRWVVTAGARSAVLWETATGRRMFSFGFAPKPSSVAFSPRGWRILTGGREDGAVRTYNCRLCAHLPGLMTMARQRLAGLRPRG
jgi:WD40 repeat protein